MAQRKAPRLMQKGETTGKSEASPRPVLPSPAQLEWLKRGVSQPGGKLPLFDENGRRVNGQLVRKCLDKGWAEPWFTNPIKPDWLVCKLTPEGRKLAARH